MGIAADTVVVQGKTAFEVKKGIITINLINHQVSKTAIWMQKNEVQIYRRRKEV